MVIRNLNLCESHTPRNCLEKYILYVSVSIQIHSVSVSAAHHWQRGFD